MTPEQQRIAITEACGWTEVSSFESSSGSKWIWGIPPTGEGRQQPIPDYLNDLNAMHEAEETLTFSEWTDYEAYLVEIIKLSPECPYRGYQTMHATAAQKAEAFVRAISKRVTSSGTLPAENTTLLAIQPLLEATACYRTVFTTQAGDIVIDHKTGKISVPANVDYDAMAKEFLATVQRIISGTNNETK